MLIVLSFNISFMLCVSIAVAYPLSIIDFAIQNLLPEYLVNEQTKNEMVDFRSNHFQKGVYGCLILIKQFVELQ